jgi:nucleoside-diphosphate-sugar epimerase
MSLSKFIEKEANEIIDKIDFKPLDGKSIIITGASGIVGTYLIACLKMYSKKSTNPPTVYAVTRSNPTNFFSELLDFKNSKVLIGDLANFKFLETFPLVDYIIHAAGYGQPGKFLNDPINTFNVNVFSELVLYNKLVKPGNFLFISTSEVYSGLMESPFKEIQIGNTNTNHFRACYIESKRCGEAIASSFKQLGVNAKSARLSLAYGPGTRPGDERVLNDFIFGAISKGSIKLRDSGSALRTYCYITDAVEMLWNILFFGKHDIYNVGGFSKTSIADLAKSVCNILNSACEIPKDDINKLSGAPEDVSLDMERYISEFKKVQLPVSIDGRMVALYLYHSSDLLLTKNINKLSEQLDIYSQHLKSNFDSAKSSGL